MVYGSGASNEFYMTSTTLGDVLTITTNGLVYSPAKVSPDDAYVYYVTENGVLYQADAVTLETRWSYTVTSGRVEADIAMNSAGTMLYVALR
jgi:outer membrane protein assembly factor BamB